MASGTVVKPTIGLESALDEFRNILIDEDKLRLSQVKGKPMMADAAIQFTALLDRGNAARRGVSIASRLYSFLFSVQQFSGVVDTSVSSKPDITALVYLGLCQTDDAGMLCPIST